LQRENRFRRIRAPDSTVAAEVALPISIEIEKADVEQHGSAEPQQFIERKDSPMGLLEVLAPWRGRQQLVDLSEQLASNCRHQVWQRIVSRAGEMGHSESRGYIRARAATVVKQEVARAAGQHQLSNQKQGRLQQLTSDAVIRLISTQLRVTRPTTIRRAA